MTRQCRLHNSWLPLPTHITIIIIIILFIINHHNISVFMTLDIVIVFVSDLLSHMSEILFIEQQGIDFFTYLYMYIFQFDVIK
jgi:hypothetical protein